MAYAFSTLISADYLFDDAFKFTCLLHSNRLYGLLDETRHNFAAGVLNVGLLYVLSCLYNGERELASNVTASLYTYLHSAQRLAYKHFQSTHGSLCTRRLKHPSRVEISRVVCRCCKFVARTEYLWIDITYPGKHLEEHFVE